MERQAKKEWLMYQDDVYSTMELEEIISRALSQLPENLRQVFEMNRFDGLTYAQIAEKQNISVKTVESYMSKSLKMMRTELKDYLPLILLFCW
jgi:RNA polymerase sigma-70 factor (ECF subfamily)